MYIPSMTPSHPSRHASIGLITKFQCGARSTVFRDTPSRLVPLVPLFSDHGDPSPLLYVDIEPLCPLFHYIATVNIIC